MEPRGRRWARRAPRALGGPVPTVPTVPTAPAPTGRSRHGGGGGLSVAGAGHAENHFSPPAVAATCLSGPLPEPKFQSDAFFQIMTSKATVVN